MANLKTEVILTMNGKAAIQVLEALTEKARAVREEIDNLDKNAPDYSKRKAGLEEVHKALLSAETDVIKGTERLDHAIQNLSSTSLQNLRKALGDGRRQLQSLSEDELEEAEVIREKMKMVGDEIRLLEGQYVKIAEGLADVGNQSDQWLDKAIKQQRDLVGSLKKTDESYYRNLVTLRKLENEEDRRKNQSKMSVYDAGRLVDSRNATPAELRRAKAAFIEARDREPIGNLTEIDRYNRYLQEIEKQLEAVSGKAQKTSMSWKQMRQVLSTPDKASGEDIKRTMEVIAQKIQQLPAGSKYVADLRRQYSMLEQTLKGTRMSQSALNDILSRSKQGKASLDELRRAYKQLEDELNQINTKSEEFAKKQKSMKELKKNIDEVTGAANKQGGAWNTALKNLTAYVGLFSVFNKAKEIVTSAIKKILDYSGSLTDIRKVSGLAMEDVNKLSNELAKIDTRTSVEGLAQLAYQGAKLGMGKYGVDGMKQFVAAADQINVAIGEEMGEEALPALAKMVETMGLIPKMGIEKAMLATGSAMFKLSSTSTATSSNIVEFAKRLTGVSRTAGITTDQLLALGSASDSLFLMPEVSATAMSKFIVALQKNHNLIEKDLGIQQGTIKNMYAAGHAMDAIVMVLEKMRDKGNMNALGSIFKDLGSDGQRLVTAMVTMSKNVDVLKDHLYESQEAFEEATAVTGEYEMQQQSAIGVLERANNLWEKAFVNPEGVNMVKSMAETWYFMSEMMTQSPLFKGTLSTALSMFLQVLKAVVVLLPVAINYLIAMGVWKTVTFLISMSKAIWDVVRAQQAMNAACKVNPYVALASVFVTIAGVIYAYANQAREAAAAQEEAAKKANAWKEKLKDAEKQTDDLTRKLHSYKVALEKVNLSQKDRNTQIARFNRDFRQYISKLGIEIKSVDDLRKHYSALSLEIQRATYYRLREEAKQDALPNFQKDRLSAADMLKKYLQANDDRYGGFSTKDIIRWFAKGADANAAYKYMILGSLKNTIVGGRRVDLNDVKFDFRTGEYSFDRKSKYGPSTGRDKPLLDRLNYLYNATMRESIKEKEIDDYFSPFVPKDYTPWVEDSPGTLENDAPDKDAIRQAKQDKRDRERSWREELKQKQDEANAIMDNVRNFYERQINAKMQEAIGLGMDETEQNLFVEPVKRRMNQALEQVRLAIAGQANTWEQFKLTMKDDLIEQTDETGVNLSEGLLKSITSNNIDALRKKLEGLANSLNRPFNSVLAEVYAKATKNAQANLNLETQQQEARRKAMQEHDYTGVVKQSAYDTFNTLGYANPTNAEVKDKEAFDKRKANIIAMFEKARIEIAQIYAADVSTEEGRGLLMKTLFGDDPDGMAHRIAGTLGTSAAEWQAFYLKLIQYSDEYIAAEKKQYDDAKKITDFLWKRNERNIAQQDKLRKIQNESKLFGKRTNLLSNLGLADLTVDPEIELMKVRMQAAEDYYAFEERKTKNKQLIDEAERARQEAELAYANQMATAMKSRLSQMKELVQPIEDFGAAVGQALAEMRYDAESANDAIKSALKSMLESWAKMALNDVNTQMWKAINDAGAKQGKANAQPDIDAARANANANVIMPDFTNIGTEQNPVWVRIVDNHYENANGDRVGAPRAWRKRNGYSSEDDRDGFAQYVGQVGGEVAGVVTSGGSLSDVAANGIGAVLNVPIRGKGKSSKDKDKQIKEEKKHQKALTKEVKRGLSDREKATDKGIKNITASTEQGNKEQSKNTEVAQQTMVNANDAALSATLTAKQQNNDETLKSDAARTKGEVTFSIAGAMAKCFEFLGPIAGPIAAAVVMSTLMGLLQWALSSALGGGKKKKSSKGPNTKVVSGMLTYDSGNVQDLRPFVGNDGSLYWATEDSKPHDGVSLLTQPTATTINGHPSLVAENGPELVIGRETTQAMMMNNPQLLKALVNYDRNYSGRHAYDAGNVAESSATIASGTPTPNDVGVSQADTNLALLQAIGTLMQRLNEPIEARIDMYGRGNLYESMTKANRFMKRK